MRFPFILCHKSHISFIIRTSNIQTVHYKFWLPFTLNLVLNPYILLSLTLLYKNISLFMRTCQAEPTSMACGSIRRRALERALDIWVSWWRICSDGMSWMCGPSGPCSSYWADNRLEPKTRHCRAWSTRTWKVEHKMPCFKGISCCWVLFFLGGGGGATYFQKERLNQGCIKEHLWEKVWNYLKCLKRRAFQCI